MRSWPILTLAFGILVLLIVISGIGAVRQSAKIYEENTALQEKRRLTERTLQEIRAELHYSGLLVRDYLLDPSHITGGTYREQLLELRASMSSELKELTRLVGQENAGRLKRLTENIDSYWDVLDPLFDWTPAQKMALSSSFLRREVLPRRTAVSAMTREIRDWHEAESRRQEQDIERARTKFGRDLGRLFGVTIVLAVLVAMTSIYRTARLEKRAAAERRLVKDAEGRMRDLSHQLVRAQEEERRAISRELHDEVGQMLTALRMQLVNLEQLRSAPDGAFDERLGDLKQLSERALRTVRDLALGLRPSMLDDLGLGPAVEWQAREFARRANLPVSVELEGDLEGLPDSHRTCIYRIVQESLTNCARHARAGEIRILVHGSKESVSLSVQDNGVGFSPEGARRRGLGLVGIQERVRELGGSVDILSEPNRGTVLTLRIPVSREAVV
jgi:signal transduction histidine kinase